MDELVARVAEKFRLAGEAGAPFRRVGARNDPYVLNPPLAEADVAAFEAEHGIRLPVAYRRFLTDIADGDADLGLHSLAEAYEEAGWADEETGDLDGSPLAQPSPFRAGETYTWRWWAANYGPDERYDQLLGALPVAAGGCSDFYLVVLNGPDAGAIYSANWDGNAGPARIADDFLSWQEANLDARVLSYAEQWDDETATDTGELLAMLHDSHEYRRTWAAIALQRVPPTGSVREALRDALRDEHYMVRAAAVTTIRRAGITELHGDVRAAVRDTSESVRLRAFRALESFSDPELTVIARDLVTDPAAWIREDAARLLHAGGALTVADVESLLDDPQWTVRRVAMRCLAEISGRQHDVLAKALADEVSDIRRLAIDRIVEVDDRRLVDVVRGMVEHEKDFSLKMHMEYVLRDG
jgi:HEAT repeat protein